MTKRDSRTRKPRSASDGYELVICEKPDAARRVADALSSSAPETMSVGGVAAFRLVNAKGRRYVVASAIGHLYGVSDVVKDRRVYPVFDLEWSPLESESRQVSPRISAIERLADGAVGFVNACDFDIEGETIGYNILRYACGGKEASARRAVFSTLTRESIVEAFDGGLRSPMVGMAKAGRLRHAVDFLWGVNLSRALTELMRKAHGYRTISIGRVQGPTLKFVVEREVDVRAFVPTPYWTVSGRFIGGGSAFDARYSVPVLTTKLGAEEVKRECEGKRGVVADVTSRAFEERPPPPFDLAGMQKEAFTHFGFSPSRTLRVAESLYLGAMISYPRTSSQKLPRIDYASLLSRLGRISGYSALVSEVLSNGPLRPAEGGQTDTAHPAIYPTGESGRRPLGPEEVRIFDLIVRRFISCFGKPAVFRTDSVEISLGNHSFKANSTRVKVAGWTRFALGGHHGGLESGQLPPLERNDAVAVEEVSIEEHLRNHPPRYNQATLLETMEKEGIGTKATRAEVIATLLKRGYMAGGGLVPTDLGLSLIEAMDVYCPQIVSTDLTREVESGLERIAESGDSGRWFFEGIVSTLLAQICSLRLSESDIASAIRVPSPEPWGRALVLGDCPVCKQGRLVVVRSRATKKRFVGCNNYFRGCKASAPLPQRGAIRPTKGSCKTCGWPVACVGYGRRSWRLCVNDRCPRKVNVYSMRGLKRIKG